MSTYNGARWLPEQLDSLLSQTHQDWVLWIRDDGSCDDTLHILRRYERKDGRVRVVSDSPDRLGPQRSFFRLLENATPATSYLMFCDQDDVWHRDKIEITLAAMRAAERENGARTPLLVHTDMRLVDAGLAVLCESAKDHLRFKSITGDVFPRLLAQNFVTGCTMMINRALAEASIPLPEDALMHDWWIALVAAGLGRLVYLPRATLDYRQHGENASGTNVRQFPLVNGLARLIRQPGHYDRLMQKRFDQSLALEEHFSRFPATDAGRLLSDYLAQARLSPIRAAFTAAERGIAMQGAARNALYYALLLRRRYLPKEPTAGAAGVIQATERVPAVDAD